ncbi:syndetin-like protein isoform X1 [Tanacetum coccineum]
MLIPNVDSGGEEEKENSKRQRGIYTLGIVNATSGKMRTRVLRMEKVVVDMFVEHLGYDLSHWIQSKIEDDELQDTLIGYGLEDLSETVVEGLSRVKRFIITGLQHFLTINVKPKFQRVKAFIKAFYLPETEYVHWARAHPEYTKSQMTGLINLVATMKGWKRKTKLEVLEKIELTSAF